MEYLVKIIYAGQIMLIEPKRFGSGYPPERCVGLASLNQHSNIEIKSDRKSCQWPYKTDPELSCRIKLKLGLLVNFGEESLTHKRVVL